MMYVLKRSLSLLLLCLLAWHLYAQQVNHSTQYRFEVDLKASTNRQLSVKAQMPPVQASSIVYNMPKIVPGTYSIYDFGRFVSDFKAWTETGDALPVSRLDDNRWQINDAARLHHITYNVEETFRSKKGNFIFEPAGSSFEPEKNFLINTHALFGYLEGMKQVPYELVFHKPANFYGASAMRPIRSESEKDVFSSENYMQLADSPIMYSQPDTSAFMVSDTEILVSVYSPNKRLGAQEVASNLKDLLHAQKNYLGGTLPVKRYAFIVYLFQGMSGSGAMGALEHASSSVYYLPEMAAATLNPFIRDVAAHEFFHILTPLNIHSEEIHDFDFINPKMSKHLWLYEGVIEYFAGHMQYKEGLISLEEYLEVIREKMNEARMYNDTLPFTVMSKKCLDEHKEQYQNVYAKGALIGLCLDLSLRKHSEGQYGLQNLMADLAREYGPARPFKDDELFDKITQLISPPIRDFFKRYVEGNETLPVQQLLAEVGISYAPEYRVKSLSLGNIMPMAVNIPESQTAQVLIADVQPHNNLGRIGYTTNDQIVSIANQEVNADNFGIVATAIMESMQPGQAIPMTVLRKVGRKGKTKLIKTSTTLLENEEVQYDLLQVNPQASEASQKLRQAWGR